MLAYKDLIKLTQIELQEHEFYHGEIDGVWGVLTQCAYNRYKKRRAQPKIIDLNAAQLTWHQITDVTMKKILNHIPKISI
jgi:hypothetical protein